MPETRIIKKYPNRRLYDTEESRYVTLADVQKLVRQGVDIRVVDSQSGEDLTRNILIQIITEQEAGDEPLFTTEMLTRFIRFYDDTVHDLFSSYLEQSLRVFADQQQQIQSQMNELFSGKTAQSWADLTQRNLELWRDMQESFLKAAGLGGTPRDKDRK